MKPLTPRQEDVLRFIRAHHAAFKICPTTREIAERFGFVQTAAAHHVKCLIHRGAPISKTLSGRLVLYDERTMVAWEDVQPMMQWIMQGHFLVSTSPLISDFFAKYPHLKSYAPDQA